MDDKFRMDAREAGILMLAFAVTAFALADLHYGLIDQLTDMLINAGVALLS